MGCKKVIKGGRIGPPGSKCTIAVACFHTRSEGRWGRKRHPRIGVSVKAQENHSRQWENVYSRYETIECR